MFVLCKVGHAQTFLIAKKRAEKFGGKLVLRIEDIDIQRCKPHFLSDMVEDLTWFGLTWNEGYGLENCCDEDFVQSKRFDLYKQGWKLLYDQGFIYPCSLSRKDVENALSAPQDTSNSASQADVQQSSSISTQQDIPNEPVLPAELRPAFVQSTPYCPGNHSHFPEKYQNLTDPTQVRVNWRFRVPDFSSNDLCESADASIEFNDTSCGRQCFTGMKDFGDFLVWRLDGYPSYELAVVVDDILMNITEVVRGQDLLISTCRQLLLMRAMFNLDFRQAESWHSYPKSIEYLEELNSLESSIPAQKRPRHYSLGSEPMSAQSSALSNCNESPKPTWQYSQSWNGTRSILDGASYFRVPRYFHAPLMCDETGRRLAKRNFAKSLRKMREEGITPTEIISRYFNLSLIS